MKKVKDDDPIQPSFPWRNQYFNQLKKKVLSIGLPRIYFQDRIKKFDVMQLYKKNRITKLGKLKIFYF